LQFTGAGNGPELTIPSKCPPELLKAIQNGETWYIEVNLELKLNYPFIAMVMGAYCSLPIAEYKVCNNQECGQPHAVQMSHLAVVALLAYKASMKGLAKPKQNHMVNILQLSNYVSQKQIIVENFFSFFPHAAKGSCDPSDVAAWCCNIKWITHWFNRRHLPPSTSAV
jgi:hypothetical protein